MARGTLDSLPSRILPSESVLRRGRCCSFRELLYFLPRVLSVYSSILIPWVTDEG
jgi:hypothetical protein